MLLSDGYAAYDRYARNKPQITQAQCWAHTRRYFERAHKSDPAAQEALTLIGGLYRVEQQIREKDLEGQKKLDYRSRHALPIADAFFAWCHQQRQRIDLVNTDPWPRPWCMPTTTRNSSRSISVIRRCRSTPTTWSEPCG